MQLEIDYEKIGLKVGLEIHQQLNTSTKLFCKCRPELFKEEPEITFLRRLRPTQSELGQIDPAAYFEFQKGVKILYEANRATSCLVEMDEEPPHPLNMEAVETALTVAMMVNAKPVDEIHVMRKTVIDGSNTTGFQRTCVVALNGEIKVGEKDVPIQHVSLEEDAARKTGEEEDNTIRYRIDRLGIPLIEVATAPVINSPKETEEVAFAIGRVLRATGRVMRGLGTIRQDLNISIPKGALIEIKGVQELEVISLVVEYEVQRQSNLINISEELRKNVKAEEQDATVFVADNLENAKGALKAVVERAREAIKGVPDETRGPNPNGTTRYMRPRPGAARMYPETDMPPTKITEDHIKQISSSLPELPEKKLQLLMKEYKLNHKLARQILDSEYGELFETVVKESRVSSTMVAVFLTETLKALKRNGIQVERVSENQIREIFRSLSAGKTTKEAIPEIFTWLSKHEDKEVQEAINSIGLKILTREELEKIVDRAIEDNRRFVEERGAKAFSVLMGVVMKEARGKVNADTVSELLRKKLEQISPSA